MDENFRLQTEFDNQDSGPHRQIQTHSDNPLTHLFYQHFDDEIRAHLEHVIDELAFMVKD